jgi:hypothetical protein
MCVTNARYYVPGKEAALCEVDVAERQIVGVAFLNEG